MKYRILLFLVLAGVLTGRAQSWHNGDIEWPDGGSFVENVRKWKTTGQINEDDNFFISRVRPRLRFRNAATQVNPSLKKDVNDKRLCAWIPINESKNGNNRNALPTGEFESECFTMWSYVDHWGNWTAPLGAMPGNFTDVAHKNGVAVSSLASIPYGALSPSSNWAATLDKIIDLDGADAAAMLVYYGSDGIGYNSEFSGYSSAKLAKLRTFHESLLKKLREQWNRRVTGYDNAEIIWYDGTSDAGEIRFDNGLGNHNYQTWGALGEERTSLFFNYNWNNPSLLQKSVDNAVALCGGRSTFELYCGINIQGGEPRATKETWSVMKEYPISIGLWGAHSDNMFWSNRLDKGTTAEARLRTYQDRLEQWFSGGLHNPVAHPDFVNTTVCGTDDNKFHGMASMMSARSALCWDLSEEPFITNFNVGNGKFFNWKGIRQNDNDWYNIGIQDYMPTWRWWQSESFLGRDSDGASAGINPQFTYEEAYLGGSCLLITGDKPSGYLHLFKTSFNLQGGDIFRIRYKSKLPTNGISLVGAAESSENEISLRIPIENGITIEDGWKLIEFKLPSSHALNGKHLALIALEFSNTDNTELYLGEISLSREDYGTPVTPEIRSVKILRNSYAGIDAKIIFNVPNSKPKGEICYNDEVGASMFLFYSQEENMEENLCGATTSWAAMSYATPFSGDSQGNGKIRFGIRSVSKDLESQSPIVWSDWMYSGMRIYSNEIEIDKTTITPNEEFTLRAIDSKRVFEWRLTSPGASEDIISQSEGFCHEWKCGGLESTGSYDLYIYLQDETEPIYYPGYISITDPARGRIPEIRSMTANGSESPIAVLCNDEVLLEYTGREANGSRSRGLAITDNSFGVRLGDVLEDKNGSFSIAGWMKIDEMPAAVNWLDIVSRDGLWPRNNWGWLWSSIDTDGSIQNYHQDYTPIDKGNTTRLLRYNFPKDRIFNKGQWVHFAFVFDRDKSKTRTLLYINGKLLESNWEYLSSYDYGERENLMQSGSTEEFCTANKQLNPADYIIIGGTRRPSRGHGGFGFTGGIDDLQIWNKAMDSSEVEISYKGLDSESLPTGVAAYFDFESEADENLMIPAKGNKSGIKGGYFQLRISTDVEGQSTYDFLPPTFKSGSPFIPGMNYRIETRPEWSVNGGRLLASDGSDTKGQSTVIFPMDETYSVDLILRNDLGSDKRTFSYIRVGSGGGIREHSPTEFKTYSVGNEVFVEFSDIGSYEISLYDMECRLIGHKNVHILSGDRVSLNLPGKGAYIMTLTCDGERLPSIKLMNI